MRLPGAEEGGAHLLRRDFFAVLALQAERLLIVRDRFVERTNRDAQVIDLLNHFLKIKEREYSILKEQWVKVSERK